MSAPKLKAIEPDNPPLRLVYVEAGSLADNPRNWRRHPGKQLATLRETLRDERIGWAGAMLFNEKSGRLLNGHARKQAVGPKAIVPVLIGSWDEAAEKQILLTLDPIGEAAYPDPVSLSSLAGDVLPDLDENSLLRGLIGDLEARVTGQSGEKPERGKAIKVTAEQREIIDQAIAHVRLAGEDPDMSEGRALELACADYLSGV